MYIKSFVYIQKMDLVEKQYESRNGVTPRSVAMLPLSIPISNNNDIVNSDVGRLQINDERAWVRSVNDHQFWAYQYSEHCEMIYIILRSFDADDEIVTKYGGLALHYQQLWGQIYMELYQNNQARIADVLLEEFRQFKLALLDSILKKPGWKGWGPPSLYEHMIREVEYVQKPKTIRGIIAFWLTDMEGHAALDAAWTDPGEESLVKKARELAEAYAELKKNVGQGEGRGHFNLLNRRDKDDPAKHNIIQFGEAVADLTVVSGDLRELLSRMIILQNGLTMYQSEYKRLADAGKIFTTMTPQFISHALRESMRANYELEQLAHGRIVH